MKFGLSFLPDANPDTKSSKLYFDEIIQLAIMADQAGLNTIKMTEHYLHSYGGYCPDPLTFLASIARMTKRIRLMTGCVLPVFHHPIQLASRAALVDVLSNGRLDVGFARAYLPYEFDAFQIDIDESRDRYNTAIDTIKRLWNEANVSVESSFFTFNNATILPRPIQQSIPIWGAAVMARQSFAWLGEQGYHLLVTPPPEPIENLKERLDIYRECFSLNHPDKKYQIAISLPLLIDTKHETAIQKCDQYLRCYLNVWTDATRHWAGKNSAAYPGYARIPEVLKQLTPENMRNYYQALAGTPAEINEKILYIKKTLSIDHFLWQVDFGSQHLDTSANTLQLLIEHIMPEWNE